MDTQPKPDKFELRNCNFEASSEKGFKMHTLKKHTKSNDQGKTFNCVHCIFLVNTQKTLDVHTGKAHTDDF